MSNCTEPQTSGQERWLEDNSGVWLDGVFYDTSHIDFPEEDYSDTGYVYFLQAGPFTKVGKAKNLDSRIKTLRIQLPFPVELVHSIYCDHSLSGQEMAVHNLWKEWRANGEWFAVPDEVLDNWKECNDIPGIAFRRL